MRVGIMRVEFHLSQSHSLKEKRRPLKSLLERLRNRFHCSAAEVDFQDLHQRAAVGVSMVAADGRQLARMMQAVVEYIHNNPDMQVLNVEQESLSIPQNASTGL